MSKISEFPTKATPVGADKLTGLDSEASNISLQNKNFALSSLWSAIFGARTTTDIPEGSNLYYTDARTLNVAVGLDGNDEVNGVKTFTSSPIVPTPTTPTQVANKAYVDAQGIPINPLNEDTVGDMDADFLVKSDGVTNEKILVNRYRATDAEAEAGTSTTKFMSPKNVKDNYFGFTQGVASNALQGSSDSVVQNTTTVFTKVKEIRIITDISGTVRVAFDLRNLQGVSSDGRIYINGTGVGTTRTTSSTTFVTYTEDISYNPGDLIQIFTRNISGGVTNEVRNFRLSFDIQRVGFTQVII